MQSTLEDKTAVITGAARGLGLSFAEALSATKCNIAVLDMLPEPSPALYALRSSHNIKVEYYKVDITNRKQVYHAIDQIKANFGFIDINVNAAGIVTNERFLTTSDANISRTFVVNFPGSFLVAQACAKCMAERYTATNGEGKATEPTTGSIIFIASIATYITSTAQQISCYTASKAAIKGLVKPLTMELSQYGIRVNSLSPGYMMTDMMRGLQMEQPTLVSQFEKETLFGRIGLPEELKGAMLWLCNSRASGWYTGQDLLVDGGATAWKHPAVLY